MADHHEFLRIAVFHGGRGPRGSKTDFGLLTDGEGFRLPTRFLLR
jgi:hypothetical protein